MSSMLVSAMTFIEKVEQMVSKKLKSKYPKVIIKSTQSKAYIGLLIRMPMGLDKRDKKGFVNLNLSFKYENGLGFLWQVDGTYAKGQQANWEITDRKVVQWLLSFLNKEMIQWRDQNGYNGEIGMDLEVAEYQQRSMLANQLIRLAYEQPQLRNDLLPLLSEDSKSASINDRTIIWEYFGTDYDNEIAYRDDLMVSSFKSFTGAVHALVALKNEAKKKGFIGRGIRFKRKGQNNMQALVQGSSDQGMGDELFYHHQIKFVGFEGEEMQNMIDIVSKW